MAIIIHFGEDNCHRSMVLEGFGYTVEKCDSIQDVLLYLRSPRLPDAVVLAELREASRVAALLTKSDLPLPVILFAGTDESYTESEFDLVIPALTSPSDWLARIGETIEQFHSRRSNLGAFACGQHERHTELV
ncbi:hypothetical protein P8935_15515 [Telmatobacter sp. DSM 110680]|uniref:Response regulatory domain-containing protein n=1 Tax=Telmatobacter sp. DSM 110680 TaxID=3036704 RepID=A0AAU7DE64_9BACT